MKGVKNWLLGTLLVKPYEVTFHVRGHLPIIQAPGACGSVRRRDPEVVPRCAPQPRPIRIAGIKPNKASSGLRELTRTNLSSHNLGPALLCNLLQLAAVRGKIYAIGGWDDNHEYLDTVEEYDTIR